MSCLRRVCEQGDIYCYKGIIDADIQKEIKLKTQKAKKFNIKKVYHVLRHHPKIAPEILSEGPAAMLHTLLRIPLNLVSGRLIN